MTTQTYARYLALDALLDAQRPQSDVHDELLFEVPDSEVDATSELVISVMQGAASLSLPLVAEAGVGRTWDEAH